jgi:hypothetical protein
MVTVTIYSIYFKKGAYMSFQFLKKLKCFFKEMTDLTMQEYIPGKREYGELPSHLKLSLDSIHPVMAWSKKCYPCVVELSDGSQIDGVYMVSAEDYQSGNGRIWPGDLLGDELKALKISDIRSIKESPSRLPHPIAEKIYTGGETGMGLFCFTLSFSDKGKQTYEVASTEIDFLKLPNRDNKDIVDVEIHKKVTPIIKLEAPQYHWVLYGSGENNRKRWYGLGFKFSPQAKVRLVTEKERVL